MKRRMKVYLIDEDEKISIQTEDTFDLNFSNKIYFQIQEKRLEIGWAELQQMEDGRLEVSMTLVGSFIVGEGVAPDLTEYKGTIPASLRKD